MEKIINIETIPGAHFTGKKYVQSYKKPHKNYINIFLEINMYVSKIELIMNTYPKGKHTHKLQIF